MLCAFSARADNLVFNGGFETGDFSGWNAVGGGTSVTAGAAHSGSYGARLGGNSFFDSILAYVPMTQGAIYDFSFYLRNDGGTPSNFQVLVNGFFQVIQINAPASGWTQYQFSYAPSSPSSFPIQFDVYSPNGFFYLDDVTAQIHGAPMTVPENGGTLLLLLCASAAVIGGALSTRPCRCAS